ncbi:MAG: hypothetical protein CME66_12070 [Halobacteriovoraceae bacterium]|nr:hypothetical protein [Halobacteriovoraceae bacterium]
MKNLFLITISIFLISCNENGGSSTSTSRGVTSNYYMYITNFDDDTIDVKKLNKNTRELSDIETQLTCDRPNMMDIHPNEELLFVACSGDDSIIAYEINQNTGELSELFETTSVGSYPHGLEVSGDGKYLYVSLESDAEVGAFSINKSSGELTLIGKYTPGNAPHDVLVVGDYVYVANYSSLSNSVSAFSINGDGSLSKIEDETTADGSRILTSYGDYLFCVNQVDDSVSFLKRNPINGELTKLGDYATGDSPTSVTVMGNIAYVANSADDTVSVFEIDTDSEILNLVINSDVGDKPIHLIGIAALDTLISLNETDEDLSSYSKNSDGSVTATGSTAYTGAKPQHGVYVSITN